MKEQAEREQIPLFRLFPALKELNAVGIAANQVGYSLAYCVVAIPDREPFLMVNPVITKHGEHTGFEDEGCLSLPGVTVAVVRHLRVTVEYEDIDGEKRKEEFGGLGARIVQHEVEHLRGELIIDHLSPIKRRSLESKIQKCLRLERENLKMQLEGVKAVRRGEAGLALFPLRTKPEQTQKENA